MIYNFDILPDRRNSESLKWHAYEEDVLPLWVADMDFVSPEPVIHALQERVAHGIFGYPTTTYRDKGDVMATLLAERMAERYGWQVKPEEVLLIPGVVTGFNLACHALGTPGGAVLVQTPVYPPFLDAPANTGMTRQDAPLVRDADGSYSIDWETFEAAITPETKLFILCNPHNPVGRVFRPDELERLAEICLRHNLFICSDEIHCDLIFRGARHTPIASLSPEIAGNTITLIAPSKTFNIAGLECSAAIIPDAHIRRKFLQAHHGLLGWVNVMGLVAAEAAYRHGQEWLDQVLLYLEANRDFLYAFVRQELPGVSLAKPEGTYLAWLDCRQAPIDGNPYTFFLEKARVALNDGAKFGNGGEGFVRLNFGCPRPVLAEALERMREALLKNK